MRASVAGMRAARAGAIAILVMAAACGDAVTADPEEVTGVLGPAGGVLRGSDGFAIAVPAGALDEPVTITLRSTTAPAEPVPDDVVAHGGHYRITSTRDAFPDGEPAGFVLAVPVPTGVATTTLGVAATAAVAGLHTEDEATWAVLRGRFDEERRALLVRLPAVVTSGIVVRLVSAPFLASPAATPPPAVTTSSPQGVWAGGFEVTLRGTRPAPPSEAKAFFERELDAALARYVDTGLRPFALDLVGVDLWLEPPALWGDAASMRYRVDVRAFRPPSGVARVCDQNTAGDQVAGEYSPLWEELTLCSPVAAADLDPMRETLVGTAYHELFHSIQKRYLGYLGMRLEHGYFIEATAALASMLPNSTGVVVRSAAYDPRPVTTGLLERGGGLEYGAQDFWAYVGRTASLSFAALVKPFLETGDLAPTKVDAVLESAPFNASLARKYAGWVPDQLIDLGPCQMNESVATGLVVLGAVTVQPTGTSGLPMTGSLTRGALESGVFKMQIHHLDPDAPLQLALVVEGSWAELDDVGPVALIRWADASSCEVIAASQFERRGERAYHVFTDATVADYYLLLMNGDHAGAKTGSFLLDPAPALTEDVTVAPTILIADQVTTLQFLVPFEDHGANVAQLVVTYDLEGASETLELDVREDVDVSGFDGATGVGVFIPETRVRCSERPKSPLAFTFRLVDDLGFTSGERSVSLPVEYAACP